MRVSSILVSHHKQSLAFLYLLWVVLLCPGSNCAQVPCVCKISYVYKMYASLCLFRQSKLLSQQEGKHTALTHNTPNKCSDSHRFHGFLQLVCPREFNYYYNYNRVFLFLPYYCFSCFCWSLQLLLISRARWCFMPSNSFRIYFDVLFSLSQRFRLFELSMESVFGRKTFDDFSLYKTNNQQPIIRK